MVKRLIFILALLMLPVCAMAAVELDADEDGKIDIEYLPTTAFSVETDPSSPEDGQIWWNETTKQLKIADQLGVYEFNATALTAWDTTPEAFSFTDVENATTSTVYTSDAITVSGINHAAVISVSGDASAKYSINNATAVSTNGTVSSGDEVRAVVTSSADASTAVNATVTIGGVSDVWSVTTEAETGGGSASAYVGWSNTNGVPDSDPSSGYSAHRIYYLSPWVADADGTLVSVNVYVGTVVTPPAAEYVCVYKDIDGTLTLVASGSYSGVSEEWTGAIELTAASGQSLSFSAGDSLYFGGAARSGAVEEYTFGRNDSGGPGAYFSTQIDVSSGLPETVSLSVSAGRVNAAILGVTQ